MLSLYIALGLILIAGMIYIVLMYFKTGVPIVSSSKKDLKSLILQLKKEINFESKSFIELGAANARFLFEAEKMGAKDLKGFELSPLHVFYVKLKAFIFSSKVQIFRKDFFKVNLEDADIVYAFLVPPVMKKVWKKLKLEAKKGTLLIILGSPLSDAEYKRKIFKNLKKENEGCFYVYEI